LIKVEKVSAFNSTTSEVNTEADTSPAAPMKPRAAFKKLRILTNNYDTTWCSVPTSVLENVKTISKHVASATKLLLSSYSLTSLEAYLGF
jgi:hypothetical protein